MQYMITIQNFSTDPKFATTTKKQPYMSKSTFTIRKFLQDHITVHIYMVKHASFLGYPTHYVPFLIIYVAINQWFLATIFLCHFKAMLSHINTMKINDMYDNIKFMHIAKYTAK